MTQEDDILNVAAGRPQQRTVFQRRNPQLEFTVRSSLGSVEYVMNSHNPTVTIHNWPAGYVDLEKVNPRSEM